MKRITIILVLAIAAICASDAEAQKQGREKLSLQNRKLWLSEMRNFKSEFLIKELSLTKEQQAEFLPVYEEMDDKLSQISSETRELEEKVITSDEASDTEIEAASRILFEQKSREGQIELEYYTKFKEVLTPRQLLRLKNAERKFTQQLVRHHGRIKADTRR